MLASDLEVDAVEELLLNGSKGGERAIGRNTIRREYEGIRREYVIRACTQRKRRPEDMKDRFGGD